MGKSKAIGPGRRIAASLWPADPVRGCPGPGVARAWVARPSFCPGHSGLAAHVRI